MLTLQLTDDIALEQEIFGDNLTGQRVALMDEKRLIGVCVFSFADNSVIIKRVGVLKEFRGRHFGDFFIRSLLFKFSLSHVDIIVPFIEKRLEKFGFVIEQGKMIAKNGEVVFPSSCGSHKV